MSVSVTRRKVLGGAVAAAFTPLSAARATAQEIIDVFRINDDPRNPTNFTYDMFAWAGEGYLAFRDGEVDVARFGDDNPPQEPTATPGGAQSENLYDPLVLYDDRDEELLNPTNLYTNLVVNPTVSQPIALLFAGIILGFAFFAVKLRSVIVGGLWLFMVLSFVLAILVDTSLVYFWIAVALGSVGLVAAVMESSLT